MARRISMTAARVGFMPTFSNSNSPSGAISAATRKNAADDTSPGTTTSQAVKRCPPQIASVAPSCRTSTPKPRSIRSLWSRLTPVSVMNVVPSAYNPANSSADFNCALATGNV